MRSPLSTAAAARAAAALVTLAVVAFAYEGDKDRGAPVEVRVTAESHAGKVWRYEVEGGGAFAVTPLVGLLHGYPEVGDVTSVRRRAPDDLRWNAWTARYPLTTLLALVALSFGGAFGLRRLRESREPG
jgi:hypothetical protein